MTLRATQGGLFPAVVHIILGRSAERLGEFLPIYNGRNPLSSRKNRDVDKCSHSGLYDSKFSDNVVLLGEDPCRVQELLGCLNDQWKHRMGNDEVHRRMSGPDSCFLTQLIAFGSLATFFTCLPIAYLFVLCLHVLGRAGSFDAAVGL